MSSLVHQELPVTRTLVGRAPRRGCRHQLVLFALPALVACSAGDVRAADAAHCDGAPFVVRDVRLFDGDRVHPSSDVYVASTTITAVGRALAVPAGTRECAGNGMTLLPGLIDGHVHVQDSVSLADALTMGVTTELDMFSRLDIVMDGLRRSGIADTSPTLADLRSSGILVTAPGGHGAEPAYEYPIPTLGSAAAADTFVRARVREGADYVKIVFDDGAEWGITPMPTLDSATLVAAVGAARKTGRMSIAHIGSRRGARIALEAGVNGLAHVFADSMPDPDFGRLVATQGTFVITTLTPLVRLSGDTNSTRRALDDPSVEKYLDSAQRLSLAQNFRVPTASKMAAARAVVAQLRAARVRVVAGTDAPNPGTAHGVALHLELAHIVNAGFTPIEALRSATSVPALIFGLTDRGRIVPGARADLLLVDGDPTTDIRATLRIAGIWKRGGAVVRVRSGLRPRPAPTLVTSGVWRVAMPPGPARAALTPAFAMSSAARDWRATNDSLVGGHSAARLDVARGGASSDANGYSLRVVGEIRAGASAPSAGVTLTPSLTPMSPPPFYARAGFALSIRGDGTPLRAVVTLRDGTSLSTSFMPDTTWSTLRFVFTDFGLRDGARITRIAFVAGPALTPRFTFSIDELRLW